MDTNPFKKWAEAKDKQKLKEVIAENLTKILNNQVHVDALNRIRSGERPVEIKSSEIYDDGHFMDRAGAVVNALCALGHKWDAANWNRDLTGETADVDT